MVYFVVGFILEKDRKCIASFGHKARKHYLTLPHFFCLNAALKMKNVFALVQHGIFNDARVFLLIQYDIDFEEEEDLWENFLRHSTRLLLLAIHLFKYDLMREWSERNCISFHFPLPPSPSLSLSLFLSYSPS
jgi:hypothetical protein